MKKKSTIILLLILSLCFSCVAHGQDAREVFTDVPVTHWANNEITTFADRGYVAGYSDKTFRPDAGVTREEFCKMLMEAFEHSSAESDEQTFADVPKERWSHGYIEAGGQYFAPEERTDGKYFLPDKPATREEITVAIVKRLGYGPDNVKNKNFALEKFSDGKDILEENLPYISFALENGMLNGYPDGTLDPKKSVSRAEAVVFLYRITLKEDALAPLESPQLEVTHCPETTSEASVDVKGTVFDENDASAVVTVNGEEVKVVDGNWSHSVKLTQGANKVEVKATNKYGKSVQITKSVNYTIEAKEEKTTKGGFAIVTKVSSARDDNGEEIIKVECTKNEEQGFIYFGERARNVGYEHKLGVGDVFMYNTDKSGYVTDYLVIAERTSDNKFRFVGEKTALEDYLTTRKKTTELVLGFIENEKRKTNSKGEVIIVNGEAYVITDDTYKYTFDTTGRNKKIEISDFMYDVDYFEPECDENGEITGYGMACPVLLRIVNGEVVDVYTSNERVKTKID